MKKPILILSINLSLLSCNSNKKIDCIYSYYMGRMQNCKIWIVDRNQCRLKIFSSFLYAGKVLRYTFNPKGETWIDNALSYDKF
jgi:hypothetical protein